MSARDLNRQNKLDKITTAYLPLVETVPEELDKELLAIGKIIEALKDMNDESKKRILEYVFNRMGIGFATEEAPEEHVARGLKEELRAPVSKARDIRSLKDEKKPRSANEMAALVAFYLSEVAPESERKDAIEKSDILKYFKQAGFRLPEQPQVTLAHAKDAGYLDPTGSRGQYRLNPVGYNLIVHGLPQKGVEGTLLRRVAKRNKPSRRKA